jgi:hypothetical protein
MNVNMNNTNFAFNISGKLNKKSDSVCCNNVVINITEKNKNFICCGKKFIDRVDRFCCDHQDFQRIRKDNSGEIIGKLCID